MTLSQSSRTAEPVREQSSDEPVTGGRWNPVSGRTGAVGIRLGAVVVMVLTWYLLSLLLSEQFVPGPLSTFEELRRLAEAGELVPNLLATMQRVVIGFLAAMVGGVVLGTLMGLSRTAEKLLDVGVMVGLTIPSLCYIIVAFLWFGLTEVGAIVAVAVSTIPAITINVWSGVKAIDGRLTSMATVFDASRSQRILRVVIPQVVPFIMAASRYGLGLVWKIVVLVELLGRPDGVGYQLNYSFQVFNMPAVFAWTLFFVLIMLVLELGILRPLERYLSRWRPAT